MVSKSIHGIAIFNTIHCTTKKHSLVLPDIAGYCQAKNEKAPLLQGLVRFYC
jgi:hypothetical protein